MCIITYINTSRARPHYQNPKFILISSFHLGLVLFHVHSELKIKFRKLDVYSIIRRKCVEALAGKGSGPEFYDVA